MCLDKQRSNGSVGGVKEAGQAEKSGCIQLGKEGPEVGEVVGYDGWLWGEKQGRNSEGNILGISIANCSDYKMH